MIGEETGMASKSIVGDLINFRGLVYSPLNENGVIFLFGKVVEGMDVVKKIGKAQTGPMDRPLQDIKINKITITQ